MMKIHKLRRHPELPWVVTISIVFVLALVDCSFITDQGGPIGSLLDWGMIFSALVGSCYCWVASYRTQLRAASIPNDLLTIRILVCWLLGPFLVLGAACLAPEIDVGLLLFYPPFFGILLSLFVLPFLLTRSQARFLNQTSNRHPRR